jgi:hypothetical protein
MHVRELRQKLESLQTTLSTWGARSSDIVDLKRLAEALGHFDDLTVAAFCNQLSTLAAGDSAAARVKSSSKTQPNESYVARYVAALSGDTLDHATMHTRLTELRDDKLAKVPELTAIASRLTGVEVKFRSKAAALEKIEAVVRRRLDTGRRLEGTSGAF